MAEVSLLSIRCTFHSICCTIPACNKAAPQSCNSCLEWFQVRTLQRYARKRSQRSQAGADLHAQHSLHFGFIWLPAGVLPLPAGNHHRAGRQQIKDLVLQLHQQLVVTNHAHCPFI